MAGPLRLLAATLLCQVCSAPAPSSGAEGQHGNLRGSVGGLEQVLVFDAGSSGTRIHIFNMYMPMADAHVPRVDLAVRDAQTLKVKPGLSEFAKKEDLEGCRLNIQDLVKFANKFVAEERRAKTPVLLKATAGLRAVPEAKADAVLRTVRSTLKDSGYQFQDSWADIIKGKEEAALAWIAANYLRGSFNVDSDVPSMGVIEMGGGSTQVTFEVGVDEFASWPSLEDFGQPAEGDYMTSDSECGVGQDKVGHRAGDEEEGKQEIRVGISDHVGRGRGEYGNVPSAN
ncbi:APY3 [Symbiodinium sp. CCMP2592]|nr:APY3 [Symbiodinium sp. CCMP2592]